MKVLKITMNSTHTPLVLFFTVFISFSHMQAAHTSSLRSRTDSNWKRKTEELAQDSKQTAQDLAVPFMTAKMRSTEQMIERTKKFESSQSEDSFKTFSQTADHEEESDESCSCCPRKRNQISADDVDILVTFKKHKKKQKAE